MLHVVNRKHPYAIYIVNLIKKRKHILVLVLSIKTKKTCTKMPFIQFKHNKGLKLLPQGTKYLTH